MTSKNVGSITASLLLCHIGMPMKASFKRTKICWAKLAANVCGSFGTHFVAMHCSLCKVPLAMHFWTTFAYLTLMWAMRGRTSKYVQTRPLSILALPFLMLGLRKVWKSEGASTVQIFWEGHKNLNQSSTLFWRH